MRSNANGGDSSTLHMKISSTPGFNRRRRIGTAAEPVRLARCVDRKELAIQRVAPLVWRDSSTRVRRDDAGEYRLPLESVSVCEPIRMVGAQHGAERRRVLDVERNHVGAEDIGHHAE